MAFAQRECRPPLGESGRPLVDLDLDAGAAQGDCRRETPYSSAGNQRFHPHRSRRAIRNCFSGSLHGRRNASRNARAAARVSPASTSRAPLTDGSR